MNKRRVLLTLLLLLLTFSLQAEAKKPNYKKIYGKILEKSSVSASKDGYKYDPFDHFVLLDINCDGRKELIAETGWNRVCFIYTIRGNKAKLIDHVICFFTSDAYDNQYRYFVEYNKKYRCLILHQHGGTGLAGLDMFLLKNSKLKQIASIESSSRWENGKDLTTYSDNYWRYYNKYYKSATKKYMYKNNSKNRARYLK